MRGLSKIFYNMEKERKYSQMEIAMKVIIRWDCLMVMVFINGRMDMNMRVNSVMDIEKEREEFI